MQQNLLLYCMHIQRDLFGGLASILGCPRAFLRLPTLEDWPFWLLRGLKGQISRLAASLRPRQPKISARQPKKSCCLCIQCNKRPNLQYYQMLPGLNRLGRKECLFYSQDKPFWILWAPKRVLLSTPALDERQIPLEWIPSFLPLG